MPESHDEFFEDFFNLLKEPVTPSDKECEETLENYKKFCDNFPNFFFWVVSYTIKGLKYTYKVSQNLGYFEQEIIKFKYPILLVHPKQRERYFDWAKAAYKAILNNGNFTLKKGESYVIEFHLLHKDGYYVKLRQRSSPFRYDINNNMVEYINVYEVLKRNISPDDKEVLKVFHPEILKRNINHKKLENLQKKHFKNYLISKLPFNELELKVLKLLSEGFNAEEIAKELNQPSKYSIRKNMKEIGQKSEKHLGIRLKNAKEIAIYLNQFDLWNDVLLPPESS